MVFFLIFKSPFSYWLRIFNQLFASLDLVNTFVINVKVQFNRYEYIPVLVTVKLKVK